MAPDPLVDLPGNSSTDTRTSNGSDLLILAPQRKMVTDGVEYETRETISANFTQTYPKFTWRIGKLLANSGDD